MEVTTFDVSTATAVAEGGKFVDEIDLSGDIQHTLNVLQRPYRHTTLNWNTSQATGLMIHGFDPLQHVLSQPMVWRTLSPYRYLRCTAHVKFQMTGNLFMGGKLIAAWIPPNRINAMNDGWSTITTLTGIQQRVEMYPSEDSTYELKIPMLLSQRFLDLADIMINNPSADLNSWDDTFLSLGWVGVWVATPLVSEDATDNANVSMFVKLENVELERATQPFAYAQPSEPSTPANVTFTALRSFGSGTVFLSQLTGQSFPTLLASEEKTKKQVYCAGEGEIVAKERSGWLSSAVRSLSDFTGVFAPFTGTFAPLVAAASATTGGLASVLAYFNLDNPRMRMLPTQVVPNFRNLANSDGVDEARHIGLTEDNAVCPIGINQPFDPEALSIQRICSIPQVIHQVFVTTATTVGTNILVWPVGPWNIRGSGSKAVSGQPSLLNVPLNHTYASWVGTAFEFWRGSCVVDVEVVAQGTCKMVFGISWIPGGGEDSTTRATAPVGIETEAMTKVVQVSGNTKAQFVIPFKTRQHWLNNNPYYQYRGSQAGSQLASLRKGCPRANGNLYIYVINPLSSFSPSGPNNNPVTFFVSTSFPDIQFARPTGLKLSSARGGTYVVDSVPALAEDDTESVTSLPVEVREAYQGLDDAGLSPKKQVRCSFDGPATAVASNTQWFGDKITSILDLVRRPTTLWGFTVQANVVACAVSLFGASPVLQKPRVVLGSTGLKGGGNNRSISNNFAVWFSHIFLTWRGEVTYTVVNDMNTYHSTTPTSITGDSSAIKMSNADLWGSIDLGQSTLASITPRSTTCYAEGVQYRPAGTPQQPATVSIPFYTEHTFLHTTDPGVLKGNNVSPVPIVRVNPYESGEIPGVFIEISETGPSTQNLSILAACGDNFSYGGLWPPPMVVDVIPTQASTSFGIALTLAGVQNGANWGPPA